MALAPIITSRLRLRALEATDAAAVFDVLGDSRTTELVSWQQPTLASTSEWIQRRIRDEERHGISMWAVEDRETDELVGLCGFFPKRDDVVEIGYVIQARHWGHGYGIEAAGAALDALMTAQPAKTIVATIRAYNVWSLAVARQVGLRQIDHYDDERGKMLVFAAGDALI